MLLRSRSAPSAIFERVTSETGSFVLPSEQIRSGLGLQTAEDVVLVAAQCLRVGGVDYAAAVCEAWTGAESPAINLTLAAALFGRGERERAVELVARELERNPDNPSAAFYRAQMAEHQGEPELAEQLLRRMLSPVSDFIPHPTDVPV